MFLFSKAFTFQIRLGKIKKPTFNSESDCPLHILSWCGLNSTQLHAINTKLNGNVNRFLSSLRNVRCNVVLGMTVRVGFTGVKGLVNGMNVEVYGKHVNEHS